MIPVCIARQLEDILSQALDRHLYKYRTSIRSVLGTAINGRVILGQHLQNKIALLYDVKYQVRRKNDHGLLPFIPETGTVLVLCCTCIFIFSTSRAVRY